MINIKKLTNFIKINKIYYYNNNDININELN